MNKFNLDEFQQKFIDAQHRRDSVYRLVAVAGAGKTTTAVMKIKSLIDLGVDPKSIIFNTFSNRSARDLLTKYNKLTGYSDKPIMSTIHSLSLTLLKKYFHIKPNLLNEWQATLVMRDVLEETKLAESYNIQNKRELTTLAADALLLTQWYKATVQADKDILYVDLRSFDYREFGDAPESVLRPADFALAFKTYEQFKRNNKQMDYADLVYRLYSLLLVNPDKLRQIKQDFPIMFVDEAQDLDPLLFHLIYLLTEHNSLYLIYDEAQTIYSFRWSSPYMLQPEFLDKHFKNIQSFTLEYNYRSTQGIVKLGNICRSLARSDVMAIAHRENTSGSVRFVRVKTNLLEGEKIAAQIKELTEQGYSYRDIAILARTNSYLKSVVEPILARENIPYNIQSKNRRKLFEKPLTKAYFDFLSLMINPDNQFALLSVAANVKGIGEKFVDRLRLLTYKRTSVFDSTYTPAEEQKISRLRNLYTVLQSLSNIDTPDKLSNVIDGFESLVFNFFTADFTTRKDLDLINKAFTTMVFTYYDADRSLTLKDIYDQITLDFADLETDTTQDAVKLLTVHAAKGLEFPVTFVGGFGQGMIKQDDFLSESCILYVQLSRAIDKLFILDSPTYVTRQMREQDAKYYQSYQKFKIVLGVS
jgi:DNA helicase-2/ATP-dependent DNA helicase PcrA